MKIRKIKTHRSPYKEGYGAVLAFECKYKRNVTLMSTPYLAIGIKGEKLINVKQLKLECAKMFKSKEKFAAK